MLNFKNLRDRGVFHFRGEHVQPLCILAGELWTAFFICSGPAQRLQPFIDRVRAWQWAKVAQQSGEYEEKRLLEGKQAGVDFSKWFSRQQLINYIKLPIKAGLTQSVQITRTALPPSCGTWKNDM